MFKFRYFSPCYFSQLLYIACLMWRYSRQITVRWLSFALALLILAALIWQISSSRPDIFTQPGLRAELTRLSVIAEYQPLWVWPLTFLVITILMLLGVPSLICFACLLVILNFYVAFIVTFLCQVFVTRISIHRAWKQADSAAYQKSISPALKSMLWQNQDKYRAFAFWARVYFAYPLRTIDLLTPMIQPDEEHLGKTLMPAATAICLRMLIPTLWFDSFLSLIKNLSPDPSATASSFLFWSSALVAYTMIPRVPELFVCSDSVKPILQQIEKQPDNKTSAKASPAQMNAEAANLNASKAKTRNQAGQASAMLGEAPSNRKPAI